MNHMLVNKSMSKYDPQTLHPSTRKYYIVKCDIDKWIKVDTHYFITLDEWRERQINKIL